VGGITTYDMWDGWDLIVEYRADGSTTGAYLYGAGEPLRDMQGNYYYQDASGSTSHLADSTGHLLEWYRYDLHGTPVFYDSWNTRISGSNYGVRHLFTGQQWYSELGLYDLRNRFYSPDIGRFLQPDPIGFWGGKNQYRYCRNNPLRWHDPAGLDIIAKKNGGGGTTTLDTVNITAPYLPERFMSPNDPVEQFINELIFGGSPSGEPAGRFNSDNPHDHQLINLIPSENIPIPSPPPMPYIPPPAAIDSSQVQMIDNEDSFSPSDWSKQPYNLQWSLSYEGYVVSTGSVLRITPREAYGRTNQIGFATAARMVPGQSVTYNFVSYNSNGFYYNGWSVMATVIDPWGIQSGALQSRISLQNQGLVPTGINLQIGGGISSYLYNQLPGSIQYNGYYYAVPSGY
jgi:RHS repeat-associated protein